MGKATILGINRESKHFEMRFKRDINFIDLYLDLLSYLKIDYYYNYYIFDEYREGKSNELNKKALFKDQKDKLDSYHLKNFDLEFFFGDKKSIIVFKSNKKLVIEIIGKIDNMSKWIKPKK